MLVFIFNYLFYGFIGLFVVVIFVVVMLLLSLVINFFVVVLFEDYLKFIWKCVKFEGYLSYVKLVGLFWGGIILLFLFNVGDIVFIVIEVVNKVGFVFFGFVLVVFLFGMLMKKINII